MIFVKRDYMGNPYTGNLKIHANCRKISINILHVEDKNPFESSLLFFVITNHLVSHFR